MRCPICGGDNPAGAGYCSICGESLAYGEATEIKTKKDTPTGATSPKGSAKGIKISGSRSKSTSSPYEPHTEERAAEPHHERAASKGIRMSGPASKTGAYSAGAKVPSARGGIKMAGPGSAAAKEASVHSDIETPCYEAAAKPVFCPKCGRRTAGGVCPVCGAAEKSAPEHSVRSASAGTVRQIKSPSLRDIKWPVIAALAAVAALVLCLCLIPKKPGTAQRTAQAEKPTAKLSAAPLSDSCDEILCKGTDIYGNTYELVATQTENAQGFEIKVGVIRNNEWLCPLTADFPFLGKDGLFHPNSEWYDEWFGDTASLDEADSIREKTYFVDIGGFMMSQAGDGGSSYVHRYVFYNCSTRSSEVMKLDDGYDEGYYICPLNAVSAEYDGVYYNRLITDNGRLVVYRVTNSSLFLEKTYEWGIFDVSDMQTRVIAENMEKIHPCGPLAEGMFFATDRYFYDRSARKVIDLTGYGIDTTYGGRLFFENGRCTFESENSIGNEYTTTIDSSGKVISESRK